jgi:hypothetical protein
MVADDETVPAQDNPAGQRPSIFDILPGRREDRYLKYDSGKLSSLEGRKPWVLEGRPNRCALHDLKQGALRFQIPNAASELTRQVKTHKGAPRLLKDGIIPYLFNVEIVHLSQLLGDYMPSQADQTSA